MAKITIVGVGALGSHVALLLRNKGHLQLIDHDRVEQKNVLSQVHGRKSVGKNKALALCQTLDFLFGVKAEAVPHRLTADNASVLLSGSDLVVDCLDNAESRTVVQSFASSLGLPCLHGGLAADGAFGRVGWDSAFLIDSGSGGGATCEDGEHLPFIGMVSGLMARAAHEFLASGRRIGFQVHPCGTIPA